MSFSGDLYPTAGAEAVMTTTGDLVRYNAGSRQRLGIGSTNQALSVVGGLPAWKTLTLADSVLTTAGDVLYENNVPELARLGVATDGDVLTLASGLPSWSTPAGGGGSMEYHESYTVPSSTGSFTWTFGSAITLADVAKVVFIINAEKSSTGATIFVKYNGYANADYNNAVVTAASGTAPGGYYNSARIYGWNLFEVPNTNDFSGTFEIYKNDVSGKMHSVMMFSGEGGANWQSGYNTGTGAGMPATLTSLYIEANTGNINANSKFDLYTLNR